MCLRRGACEHMRGLRRRARAGALCQCGRCHHLRVRKRTGQDRRLSRQAQAGHAGPAGSGDDAGQADREGFPERVENPDRAIRRGAQRDATGRSDRANRASFGAEDAQTRLRRQGSGQDRQSRRPDVGLAAGAERTVDPRRLHRFRARGLGRGGAFARRQGRMLRGHGERASRPHPEDLARAGQGHGRGRDAGTPHRHPHRASLRLCRRARGRDVRRAQGQGLYRAGQRNRAARAQFRPLDHRRRQRIAVRAAHPRGGGHATCQASPNSASASR